MKAVVVTDYGAPEVMKYMSVDHPKVKSNQVLIRVVATSVNFPLSGQKSIENKNWEPI